MNLALLTLAGVGITGAYFGYKKKDPSVSISNCFFGQACLTSIQSFCGISF
ncbi:hypothetical protein [Helicobacter sp.]|uniref:hypothetical protein n=1 Tax=Helicobacter sp. TaxID=218 RepID=UPI0019C3D2DC|nr:hypothetical protein [Helicobacter sp.]MBD5165139.1 hypothetical protein [Helicobacter sp.]